MKKIPTMFVRTPDRRHITDQVTPGCEWVANGEGVATRKWDGTCCMIRDGKLYKRRDVRAGKPTPPDFEPVEHDDVTGRTFGWMPVGDGPDDALHREAFATRPSWPDGTFELIGPKINGNRDHWPHHALVPHGGNRPANVTPRTFAGLYDLLVGFNRLDWEGIVFYHPDGRMAKVKARDFPPGGKT